MKTALVTANYRGVLTHSARASFKAAAGRWGAEYREFTEENHAIRLHPATVKMEAFALTDADRVFIIDADAIIRADCPSPFDYFPDDAYGVVALDWGRLDPTGSIRYCGEWEWNKLLNLPGVERIEHGDWQYFNSGVMVASRALHEGIMAEAWALCHIPNDLGWIEQTPINYALKKAGAKMHYADETWNYIGIPGGYPGPGTRMERWIYHFAGSPGREEFVNNIRWDAI